MILHATDMGEGPPAILLHGLFGTANNFGTIQRGLSVGRRILAFDLRNHGRSGHDQTMTYALMADDVFDTMHTHGLERAALVGHSMGGKVAMLAALRAPERVTRLLVADISPVAYPPRNAPLAQAMLAVKLTADLTRAAADQALSGAVDDPAVRNFLLSNLRFGQSPQWRIALPEIAAALPELEGWSGSGSYEGPTLVLRGERSDFVQPEHRPLFRALFPHARFVTLRGAGHWLHADAPEAFIATLAGFLPTAGSA